MSKKKEEKILEVPGIETAQFEVSPIKVTKAGRKVQGRFTWKLKTQRKNDFNIQPDTTFTGNDETDLIRKLQQFFCIPVTV